MNNFEITTASAGRERTCTQCGTTYRAQRSTSTYCSKSCRQKGNRRTAPKTGPDKWSIITTALHSVGYVGCIGPVSTRAKDVAIYGLLVPNDHAFDELSVHFNRKDWGSVSREEFSEALRSDGIQPFYSRSPEAVEQKLWRDRTRQRLNSQL